VWVMEQVYPTEGGASSLWSGKNQGKSSSQAPVYPLGVVEKAVGPGNFLVVLEDGSRIEVRGSSELKPGSRVRLSPPPGRLTGGDSAPGVEVPPGETAEGLQWLILIPLAFGGENASGRLEVFVERQKEGLGSKPEVATYFVFTVQTDANGEVQWSIYLKGRQIALQVFSQGPKGDKESLKRLLESVEEALKKGGFVIMAPGVLLSRPFKVPAGFRLNVQG